MAGRPKALSGGPQLELISTADLAGRLKVSIRTVQRAVRRGIIPAVKVGGSVRFDVLAVKAALANRKR